METRHYRRLWKGPEWGGGRHNKTGIEYRELQKRKAIAIISSEFRSVTRRQHWYAFVTMETRRFRWYIRNSISWITKKKNQSKRYRYDFVPFPDSGSRSNAVWGNKKKKRKEKRRTLQENTRMDIAKNDRRRHGNAPFFFLLARKTE